MGPTAGITIHFNDGTTMAVTFPQQTDNRHARDLMRDEVLQRRMLTVEADGAMLFIPFENIKYVSTSPAPDDLPRWCIRGATITT